MKSPAENRNDRRKHQIISLIFILLGTFFILLGLGIIPADESSFNAPKWIVRLCGMIFVIAGIMVQTANKPGVNDLMAAVLILIFAIIGGWAALYGNAEDFSGGIPFLGKENNVFLGRIMFGAGSVICLMISLYALRIFIRKRRETGE